MKVFKSTLTFLGGSLLLAAFMYCLLAAPGFLSDRDSVVPITPIARPEAGR